MYFNCKDLCPWSVLKARTFTPCEAHRGASTPPRRPHDGVRSMPAGQTGEILPTNHLRAHGLATPFIWLSHGWLEWIQQVLIFQQSLLEPFSLLWLNSRQLWCGRETLEMQQISWPCTSHQDTLLSSHHTKDIFSVLTHPKITQWCTIFFLISINHNGDMLVCKYVKKKISFLFFHCTKRKITAKNNCGTRMNLLPCYFRTLYHIHHKYNMYSHYDAIKTGCTDDQ